jgi:hypothetical protein
MAWHGMAYVFRDTHEDRLKTVGKWYDSIGKRLPYDRYQTEAANKRHQHK